MTSRYSPDPLMNKPMGCHESIRGISGRHYRSGSSMNMVSYIYENILP